ncbi:hypothetical protein NJB14195_00200, partial [Mycobacterium montefiorense]
STPRPNSPSSSPISPNCSSRAARSARCCWRTC